MSQVAAAFRRTSTANAIQRIMKHHRNNSSFAVRFNATLQRNYIYCDNIKTCSKRICQSRSATSTNKKSSMISSIPPVNGCIGDRNKDLKQRDPNKWLYLQVLDKLDEVRAKLQPALQKQWQTFGAGTSSFFGKLLNNPMYQKVLGPLRSLQIESGKAAVDRQKYREEIQKMKGKDSE